MDGRGRAKQKARAEGDTGRQSRWMPRSGQSVPLMSYYLIFIRKPVGNTSTMSTAKNEVRALLDKLPDDCTLEDVQCHLYAVKKLPEALNEPNWKERLAMMKLKRNSTNG